MLFIAKIGDTYDFAVINFGEYSKSSKENIYSKINKEQNLRNIAKLLCIFLTTPDERENYAKIVQTNSFDNFVHHYNIDILNLFDSELQLINFKPIIRNKFK